MDRIYKWGVVWIVLFIKSYKFEDMKATPVALHAVSLIETKNRPPYKNPCEGFDSFDMH
jgi:hypothetical protein